MKRKIFAVGAACLLTFTATTAGSINVMQMSAEAEGSFLTAHEIAEDIVLGWNLGNTFDCYSGNDTPDRPNSETLWGNPRTTKDMIAAIAETSDINAIRMPVTWFNHLDENNNIDPLFLDRVEEVVNYILDEDMYCIINMHHDTGDKGWLRASSELYEKESVRFLKIWEQLAERFRDYDGKLIFEGYNEILDEKNTWAGSTPDNMKAANDLNQAFVDTVRASGGGNAERCLMVAPYAARYETAATQHFVMPEDTAEDKILVDVHAYVPYAYTMQAVEMWSSYNINASMAYLESRFVENDIPIIIGEFGAVKKEDEKNRIAWAKYYIDTAEALGIPCFWWDSGESDYGLFDRHSQEWYYPNLLKTMTEAAQGREYVVPVSKLKGDANLDEKFDLSDLVTVQKYLLGLEKLDDDQKNNANVSGTTEQVNLFDLVQMKQMLLTDLRTPKNMVTNKASWYLYEGDAVGSLSVEKADAIEVTTEQTGSFKYYMQAIYPGLSLKAGKTYEFSCTITSEDVGVIEVCIQHDDGDYETFKNQTIMSKAGVPQDVTITYTPDEDCEKARINFNCGYLEGVYHVTDISFMELKD